MDYPALEAPNILILQVLSTSELPGGIAHHVLCEFFMEGARNIDVFA